MKKHSIRAVILLMVFFLVPVFATTVRELNWDDLKPVIEFDDPFEKLTPDQLFYLRIVARTRQFQDNGKEISKTMREEYDEAEAILARDEVDIDGLFAKRVEVREMRRKRAESVVPDLDNASVVMPGFILPLEYAGTKVTEFLLVPWVGACIHTPPPPANQIVHVVVDEKMARESKRLFEPVNVTGTMFTKRVNKNLFLKDGSSDINIGYSMQASMVEPYKEKPSKQMEPST
jgi:hypothetical protein